MGWLSIRKFNLSVSNFRNRIQSNLHKAARGNHKSFCIVADQYLNFITEYLVVAGYHEEERIRHYCGEIYHNLWLRIAYLRRVSDFESQLFVLLKTIPVNVAPFQDLLTQKLIMLNSLQRFLVVGRDLENWSAKNLSLSSRRTKQELKKPLFDAWIIMTGFRRDTIEFATNECMEKVVEHMKGILEQSEHRRLCKKVKQNAIASEFKAECLQLRCELVELRQNARWTDDYKREFLNDLIEDISAIEPLKAELTEKLKNQTSFQYVPLEVRNN